MAKQNADYTRLADQADLELSGFMARCDRTEAEINRLLDGVKNREAIMQAFNRHAVNVANREDARDRLARYIALRDRPAAPAGAAKSS